MAVVLETTLVLAKGVPQVVYTALPAALPGYFGGKMNLIPMPDADDIVNVSVRVKYTSGGAFVAAEPVIPLVKKDSQIFRFTPTEETYGYEVTVELDAASISASVSLPIILTRSPVP